MLVIGLILLVLGFVFAIKILWVLGIIALVIGLCLLLVGALGSGNGVGGRRYWF